MLVVVSYAPKQISQFRFAHSLQVKTDILLTKVIRGKVVEEIELIYVHCFTTWEIQNKTIKIKDNLSQSCVKTNFLSRPLYFFCNRFKVFGCHWLVSHQKWHQPLKFKFYHQNQLRRPPGTTDTAHAQIWVKIFKSQKLAITLKLLIAATWNLAKSCSHQACTPSYKISAPIPPAVQKLSPKRFIFNSFQDPCQDSFQDPGLDSFEDPKYLQNTALLICIRNFLSRP